jgi:hypothetical protein
MVMRFRASAAGRASQQPHHSARSGRHPARKVLPPSSGKNEERKNLIGKTCRKARRSAERSQTPESHLDEKVRSAETIEREQRVFESMLRKTKVNLLYAMMRRSRKFYSMSANVSNCVVAHRVNSAERRLARAQYPSTGHYVFIADRVYDFGS